MNNLQDSSDDEAFEEASEQMQSTECMDLSTAIEQTMVSLHLFLNNRFEEAKSRFEVWMGRSMYHSLGYSTMLMLQACMTFEAADIETAVEVSKKALAVCNTERKKQSLLNKHYENLTEVQAHAELCYAECLLQRALLTFMHDENLIGFIRGGLKIRACYHTYRECEKIMQRRQWADERARGHFESGVLYGLGQFNLNISLLPAKLAKILEFVGFSGNKAQGLESLTRGYELGRSLRQPMCGLTLLAYHTIITYVLGTGDGDIELSQRLIDGFLEQYPQGALFLFFAGRVREVRGDVAGAVQRFEQSIASQQEWKQFHHLCYWELMWCSSFQSDWLLAMKYAERMSKESRWSRAAYTYLKAVFLLTCEGQSAESRQHVAQLLRDVPGLKQKIAGKSLPIEKFAVKKAQRYFDQHEHLTLPAYEMIYIWNGFLILGKNRSLVEPMLVAVETEQQKLTSAAPSERGRWHADDVSLTLLLQGVCLKHLGETARAEHCFQQLLDSDAALSQDVYLAAYTSLELGLLYAETGRREQARETLHRARHAYKGYSMESRLHFRVHAARAQFYMSSAETSQADAGSSQAESEMSGSRTEQGEVSVEEPGCSQVTQL